MTVTLVLKPENTIKHATVSSGQTIAHLRNVVAETFGIPFNEFKLSCKGSLIDTDEDDSFLYSFPYGGPYIVHRTPPSKQEGANFHPKNIMTESSECIDLLFKLLSEDVQGIKSF